MPDQIGAWCNQWFNRLQSNPPAHVGMENRCLFVGCCCCRRRKQRRWRRRRKGHLFWLVNDAQLHLTYCEQGKKTLRPSRNKTSRWAWFQAISASLQYRTPCLLEMAVACFCLQYIYNSKRHIVADFATCEKKLVLKSLWKINAVVVQTSNICSHFNMSIHSNTYRKMKSKVYLHMIQTQDLTECSKIPPCTLLFLPIYNY